MTAKRKTLTNATNFDEAPTKNDGKFIRVSLTLTRR